ncbi:MAG TPA: FtsH protease activity modulator HflK [Pseudomonadales bacterium]|nr:FtsH protease activity modulator HflK [Pseudomonadales bacterium]
MAWNEPGGGDDKDPWGNRGDQGPPDLDEAFKKLQNNLTEMFGGGRRGSGGGGGGAMPFNSNVILLGLGIVLFIWFAMGVYVIDQQEKGIVLRFGKALPGEVLPGLHWNPPLIDRVMKANVTRVRTIEHDAQMLTEDENIVKVKMSVQYVIGDIRAYLLQVSDPDQTLSEATESALRHEVGSSEMNDVLTEGRADLSQRVKERIQTYMDRYGTGIAIRQVIIDETAPPDEVLAAFDDVIKAREDEIRFKNEANAYANQIVPEARGQAQKILEQSQGYEKRVVAESGGEAERFNKLYAAYKLAPVVTRERMYIDAMQSVYSNSTKVMVDVKGGSNLLYLPLDKIIQQSTQKQSSSSGDNGGTSSSGNSTSSTSVDTTSRPVSRRDYDR